MTMHGTRLDLVKSTIYSWAKLGFIIFSRLIITIPSIRLLHMTYVLMFFCPTHQKCDCGNACTESPSPEQTQKMNHRLRDTLQKEKLTTRFRCYCGLKMETK